MPANVTAYNAHFNSFVNFAEQSAAAGNRGAVANAKTALADREITIAASKTDAAYSAFSRSTADKEINDQTRALFRKAVADIFGGENRIPERVRNNMKINDYGKGRPLTARRILEVKSAIDAELVARAFEDMLVQYGKDLEPDEVTAARRLFNDHSAGLPPKNAAMFARYVFALDLSDDHAGLDAKAARMAKEMKTWRDFGFGDAGVGGPRNVVKQAVTSFVTSNVARKDFHKGDEFKNISTQMYADVSRSDITINGRHVEPETDKADILRLFQAAVPGAKAQQLISWAMNQGLAAPLIYSGEGNKVVMDDGSEPVDIRALPGGKILAGRNGSEHYTALMAAKNVSYTLDVSEDGKTATLVNTMENLLMVGDRPASSATGFGSATQSIKVTFDLSNPEAPFISDVDIAQTLGVDDPAKA